MFEREQRNPLKIYRCGIFNQDGEVLLLRRAFTDTYNPGVWELPGGKAENDEDNIEALRREVWEECGLKIVDITKNPYLIIEEKISDGKYKGSRYFINIYLAGCSKGKVVLSNEHIEYLWCMPEKIRDIIKDKTGIKKELSDIDFTNAFSYWQSLFTFREAYPYQGALV